MGHTRQIANLIHWAIEHYAAIINANHLVSSAFQVAGNVTAHQDAAAIIRHRFAQHVHHFLAS